MVFPHTEESKEVYTSVVAKRTFESNAHSVLVVDVLNVKETVYGSIREAAQGIGCVHGTIIKALKNLKKTGESRLIKKRFKVKPLD